MLEWKKLALRLVCFGIKLCEENRVDLNNNDNNNIFLQKCYINRVKNGDSLKHYLHSEKKNVIDEVW